MLKFVRSCRMYTQAEHYYAATLASKKVRSGEIARENFISTIHRNLFCGKVTYLYRYEGLEMAPTIPGQQETLLVRSLFYPDDNVAPKFKRPIGKVFVGDVIVARRPLDSQEFLVRRLAALQGQEMVSSQEEDESFVIEKGHCWILSDNENLEPQEAKDSRTFGPIPVTDIVGRVIYRFQSAENHGIVQNSKRSRDVDMAILKFELELDEMERKSRE